VRKTGALTSILRRLPRHDIGLPTNELRPMIRSVFRGKPPSEEKDVDAVTRRENRIKVRVSATALVGRRRAGGVVVVMEELKN
jgi:hypothetical protein